MSTVFPAVSASQLSGVSSMALAAAAKPRMVAANFMVGSSSQFVAANKSTDKMLSRSPRRAAAAACALEVNFHASKGQFYRLGVPPLQHTLTWARLVFWGGAWRWGLAARLRLTGSDKGKDDKIDKTTERQNYGTIADCFDTNAPPSSADRRQEDTIGVGEGGLGFSCLAESEVVGGWRAAE